MKREEQRVIADFVHKLGIVLKELNETAIWLRDGENGIARRYRRGESRAMPDLYGIAQNRSLKEVNVSHFSYSIGH